MNIAVIGAGYVGLVTAAGLASIGHHVKVGEVNADRVRRLRNGDIPFHESGLDALVREGIEQERLSFHTSNLEAVEGARVVMIALPTPPATDGSADLSFIDGALTELAPALSSHSVVVTKSTVPVGSVARFQELLTSLDADATVVSNPEFLREGSAVSDFFHPDRIVIGTHDPEAADALVEMYKAVQAPILITDPPSAEMIKYASNAYLASRITFANAIANLCESVNADAATVLEGMGHDRRIGFHFLNPGPGYGGSCFPKDTRALVAIADNAGYDFSLLKGVIEVNELQLSRMIDKIMNTLDSVDDPVVGLWGLAFKAGTDDVRESPAVKIANALADRGVAVRAFDPAADPVDDRIHASPDAIDAAKGADTIVIATEWPEFSSVDLGEVKASMRGSAIVDARNMLDPEAVRRLGLTYAGVGR